MTATAAAVRTVYAGLAYGPGTQFYLDPPYWGRETDYGKAMFSREDFTRMAEQLATMQGRFILSVNDVPEIRTIFAAFQIDAIMITYSIANCGAGSNDRAELLISRL